MTDKTACFSRQVRLLKPDEYSRVFKNPVRCSDRYLTILAVEREGEEFANTGSKEVSADLFGLVARLGLAISKKNAKRAVDRNRIKRLIRESFRNNLANLPAIDMVVMAKPITKNAENQQILQSLEQHWTKLAKNFQKQNSLQK